MPGEIVELEAPHTIVYHWWEKSKSGKLKFEGWPSYRLQSSGEGETLVRHRGKLVSYGLWRLGTPIWRRGQLTLLPSTVTGTWLSVTDDAPPTLERGRDEAVGDDSGDQGVDRLVGDVDDAFGPGPRRGWGADTSGVLHGLVEREPYDGVGGCRLTAADANSRPDAPERPEHRSGAPRCPSASRGSRRPDVRPHRGCVRAG